MKYGLKSPIFVFKCCWEQRKVILLLGLLEIISLSCLPLLYTFIYRELAKIVSEHSSVFNSNLIVLLIFIGILQFTSAFCQRKITFLSGELRMSKIVTDFFHKNVNLLPRETENMEIIAKLNKAKRASDDSWQGFQRMVETVFLTLGNFCGAILLIALTGTLNFTIILLILAISIVIYTNNKKIVNDEYKTKSDIAEENIRRKFFVDCANDHQFKKELMLNKISTYIFGRIKKSTNRIIELYRGMERKILKYNVQNALLEVIRYSVIFIVLAHYAINGEIKIYEFVMYFSAANSLVGTLLKLFENVSLVKLDSLFINDFIDYVYNLNTTPKKGKKIIVGNDIEIEFRNVSFGYNDNKEEVISNFSCKFKSGDKVAIVGENGAGKSTLIKLLCGFYVPTSGAIYVNGINLTEIDLDEYWEKISSIFQDTSLFSFTLLDNIIFDKENDAELLADLIKDLDLESVFSNLSKGLHTNVTKLFDEEGVQFSGGQQQMIFMLRALYKDSPILILDEPTSALDPINEKKIYNNYAKMAEGRLSFFISHRLVSTQFCNKIIVMEDGKIVEIGTHSELMLKNGLYAELYNIQAKNYLEVII